MGDRPVDGLLFFDWGFKFGFIGQGSALDPLKGLLKKSLKNPQNF